MNLKNDYNKLYQHWLKELQQPELTLFNREIFHEYKKKIDLVNKINKNNKDKIELAVILSYQNNFNFIFDDLLKMRKIKIINRALALQEINVNEVIEAEKLLFQNLISALKGYEKVKRISENMELETDIVDQILEQKSDVIVHIVRGDIITDENNMNDGKNYNYTIIRFLKKTPPLVGIDLINYGPFHKEDIANLPFKNAKILILEKFAEKIDID